VVAAFHQPFDKLANATIWLWTNVSHHCSHLDWRISFLCFHRVLGSSLAIAGVAASNQHEYHTITILGGKNDVRRDIILNG
jgi:hypothetical protein